MADAAAITLARHFDSRRWRAIEKAAALPRSLYGQVQERHPQLVQRWDPAAASARIPEPAIRACMADTASLGSEEKLQAFCHAVAAGAHGIAASLADEVVTMPGAIRALHQHYLATGDTERAQAWRTQHARELSFSGTIDPLEWASRIDEGRLTPEGVAALLVKHRRALLGNAELHLLAHRALLDVPEAARLALNRYLRVHGSDQVESAPRSDHYLRDLRLAKAAPVTAGPRVSVLISAYNAEATIEYALRSVLDQSYQNLEVLFCDDASSDSTLHLVQEKFASEPRLRLYRSKANQGSYNVRNALIAEAAGDLISAHDADDISLPRRIELQVAQLRDSSKKASVTNFLRVMPEGPVVFFADRKACRMAIVSLMASREVFAAIGSYRNARFGADFEFLEKLKDRYGAGSVARIRSPQLFCLWAAASVTRSAKSEALASGYRSPARRAYSDHVYRERVLGRSLPVDEAMQEIIVPAAGIEPV